MKKLFLLAMTTAVAVSARAYSGLAENLKNRAVTWPYEYETGKTNTCFVLGSPSDYSANWWEHKKESVYDGYTWYTHTKTIDGVETEVYENQGYFECNNDEAWSGYQLSMPMHVTRIRFWAGRDADWADRVGRSRGVKLQGANTADFSDAVTFYTIFEDNDTLNAGPIDITVSNQFLNATYTYVRMLAPAGNYCGNVAEVEFYGVESLVKPLSGTVLASEAESTDRAASLAMDGDDSTYYKSTADNGYWGLDLGAVKRVGGFRFIPEPGQTWRCAGGMVQYATQSDFSDAVTIVTRDWNSPSNKVATTMAFDAVAARYVRFLANGRACSLAEAEFFAPYETPTETPTLTAAAADGEAGAVTISWTAPVNACSKIAFERATAPGGPYVVAAEVDSTLETWNEPSALGGVTYYYRAKFVDEDPTGTTYAGELSEGHVSAKGMMQLDRDATGALREGCQAIWYDYPWGGDTSHTAAALFDGDLATFADVEESSEGKPAIGIDLGTPCKITYCSVYPRAEQVARLNNFQLCGYAESSDAGSNAWWSDPTKLSDRLATSNESEYVWYAMSATRTTNAMQCVYLKNDYGNNVANAAEMKVFGYRVADVEGVLLAPLTGACEWRNADAVLAWEACQNAESYRIDRKSRAKDAETAAWSDWTIVGENVTATTWRDRTTTAKEDYIYRIVSVNGAEVAYSDDILPPTGDRGKRRLVITIR